ncbi:MAG: hypothetical protein MUF18_17275 [Fimbriiglobus sp.]|jgi:hypothetical protein|nr:hypothetical protein [Fimbriiglobus sp.]
MVRTLLTLLAATAASAAVAQIPGSMPSPYGPIAGPQSFAPNYFNRNYQPLSPYLNLANNFNPAAGYYYGVRPATQGPTGLGPVYGSGAQFSAPVGRSMFLPSTPPSTATNTDPLDNTPRAGLPSPGGPVGYGNYFGSSRVGVGAPRPGFFGGAVGGGSTVPPPRTPTAGGAIPGRIAPIR